MDRRTDTPVTDGVGAGGDSSPTKLSLDQFGPWVYLDNYKASYLLSVTSAVGTSGTAITSRVHSLNRPNMVSVGTIVWLSSELMFFAGLFAMYFTARSQSGGSGLRRLPN